MPLTSLPRFLLLGIDTVISFCSWFLFILPVMLLMRKRDDSVTRERKVYISLLKRKIKCASVAVLSTFIFLLFVSLHEAKHGFLVCEVVVALGTLDLLFNFVATNLSWPLKYYMQAVRGCKKSQPISRVPRRDGFRPSERKARGSRKETAGSELSELPSFRSPQGTADPRRSTISAVINGASLSGATSSTMLSLTHTRTHVNAASSLALKSIPEHTSFSLPPKMKSPSVAV
uniref:Uncharacterized protein n=1 Tax=Lotharella globosa TaxID=91324 RepID=A0A7S3YPC4_9EUKA|mmetsp:Transcript_10699/g.21117  ORF Transcript_10699/g.21117 Transcript_10699/m.21117 type:complete len:231 (+) Transcript_10699:51-743(+)